MTSFVKIFFKLVKIKTITNNFEVIKLNVSSLFAKTDKVYMYMKISQLQEHEKKNQFYQLDALCILLKLIEPHK